MLIVLVALLAAVTAAPLPLPSATGHWEGLMRRGSSQLAVSVDISADTPPRGFFSASDLGAIDVPLSALRVGRAIHWELVGDTTTTVFEGTLDENGMTGTFRENARTGTFVLHRSSTSTAKPYRKDNVSFANGNVRLAGTVFAPRGAGKHPAAILVQGSGPEGRWATEYIADYLARNGIVALSYDKRGVGGSTGDWRTSTMDDLAADARAGVHFLAQRGDVDAGRVGVYGHSQGAEIAPAIAEHNPEVKWVAAADGPVGPQFRQDLYRVDTELASQYSGRSLDAARKLYAEFVDVARAGLPHEQLRIDMQRSAGAPWLDDLAIPDDNSWIWSWYRKAGNYDNSQAWATVRVPVLLLFGENDALVPPQLSIAETVRILKAHGNANVRVHVFPGADHTLRVPARSPEGWPHNATGFPGVLAAFIKNS